MDKIEDDFFLYSIPILDSKYYYLQEKLCSDISMDGIFQNEKNIVMSFYHNYHLVFTVRLEYSARPTHIM